MLPLEILIVDDEPIAARRLVALLRGSQAVEVVGSATNATAALEFAEALRPDLMLLDIEMPGVNGIAVADQVRRLPNAPSVIFVTAFSRFAIEAFDVSATDYLLKPVEAPRLAEAIERVRAQRSGRDAAERIADLEDLVRRLRAFEAAGTSSGQEVMWLPAAHGHDRVAVSEIVWVEAERDYVRIHVGGRSYFTRGRLGDFERQLAGEGMLRIHRSALVRATAIARIEARGDRGYRLFLTNGATVDASRRLGARVRTMTATADKE